MAVGRTYLLPPFSSDGASLARPWLRFHTPLIEPDMKICRGPIYQGMGETGFAEGQNMVWEYRWAEFHHDRLRVLAAGLVARKVDLIVTYGGAASALAAKNATSTIPIVFTTVGDPVGFGLVASDIRIDLV